MGSTVYPYPLNRGKGELAPRICAWEIQLYSLFAIWWNEQEGDAFHSLLLPRVVSGRTGELAWHLTSCSTQESRHLACSTVELTLWIGKRGVSLVVECEHMRSDPSPHLPHGGISEGEMPAPQLPVASGRAGPASHPVQHCTVALAPPLNTTVEWSLVVYV